MFAAMQKVRVALNQPVNKMERFNQYERISYINTELQNSTT